MFLLRMLQDATNQGVGPESSVLSVPQDGGSNLGYASPLSPGELTNLDFIIST